MNAIEIEEAISKLAEQPFDSAEFPYAFLEAFGNKATTIKRLRNGTNKSDIEGGVLQSSNIHLAVSPKGEVLKTLAKLKASPATSKQKAKFILATDGENFQAEDLVSGDTIACTYRDFSDYFSFWAPLAGITRTKELKETELDRNAAKRLNRLYIELLKDNPEWGTEQRRPEMNHFMARLIFCFFAEDTDIFKSTGLFTSTIEQMSAKDSSNTHEVIGEIFKAMNTPTLHEGRPDDRYRKEAGIRSWADTFPYVNGGLFSGSTALKQRSGSANEIDVPHFSKIARSYLLHVGNLDWKKINPDIFGSMIQAVADDEERGAFGMHYTSVPNILKVLNPLFLDDLREQLEAAGDSPQKLLNLRKRMARIRVFDPACGSGNFLVIAYKEMRAIEAEINIRRGEPDRRTEIPITNFRGIELRDFPAEIARLALIIAEYQCDVTYRGQKEALAEFLPLDEQNWITCGNALRLDWLSICPPTGKAVKLHGDDLFNTPLDQAQIDFENEGGETYICGNPPFKGTRKQEANEKEDLQHVFSGLTSKWKNVDYVGAWFLKAALYNKYNKAPFAFVATNSLCQGQQVPITWSLLFKFGCRIRFAHTSFIWKNLAVNKAGVTVIIVGVDFDIDGNRFIFSDDSKKTVSQINPYLTDHRIDIIPASKKPIFTDIGMDYGVYYSKSAGLILSSDERHDMITNGVPDRFIKKFIGSTEFINGKERYCLWLSDDDVIEANKIEEVSKRIQSVKIDRLETSDEAVNKLAAKPHQFRERKGDNPRKIFIPIVSSENREYFPVGLADETIIPTNKAFFISNAPNWALAILASRTHLVWIATICGRLRSDYSYSNILGWNTFPVPPLTEKNKADLTRCAEDILLAREAHFPATIADLYEVKDGVSRMPENLRHAHYRNDEVLERIYIGRRFKNDTERLEKLFDLYTKMTAEQKKPASKKVRTS